MNIPFTIEQFMDVMVNYNLAVWPFQVVLNLLAVVAVIFSFKKFSYSDKINSAILAFLWIWIGVAYLLSFFTSINPAAYFFGVLFIIQGFVFIYSGIFKSQLSFNFTTNSYSVVGAIFILYALLIYPIFGYYLGHIYPESPTFGLPCPTTIFTFGLLLFTDKKFQKYILIIPFVWSLIGFSAAVNLRVIEDFGLFFAGVIGFILILFRDKKLYLKQAN